MGSLLHQTAREIRQLPTTIAKIIGGTMAAIGFPGAIGVVSHGREPSVATVATLVAAGIAGVAVFVVASRVSTKRAAPNLEPPSSQKDRRRMSMVAWGILLALAGIFIAATYLLAG